MVATTPTPVILVGNSLGGWLAADWAIQNPSKVKHLVLINNAGFRQGLDKSKLLPSSRQGIQEKNIAIMGDYAPTMPGFLLDGLVEMHQNPTLSQLFDHLVTDAPYLDGKLGPLNVPTSIIWGTPDPFFPKSNYLPRVLSERPGVQPLFLDGCGHAPQYSCPDAVADHLKSL